jgi:hypothetical protein
VEVSDHWWDNLSVLDVAWRIACEFDRPDITDDELEWLLWERTAYPTSSWAHVATQLRDALKATP